MALRAVTLDAAGTLVAVAEPVGETYARTAGRHGLRISPAKAEAGFRRAFAVAPPLAFPGASPSRLDAHERAWWYTIVRQALGATARGPAFDACFEELYAHYATAAAWRVLPGVHGVLANLRARGLRLAVVSNFDGRLGPLLDGLGLRPLVDAVIVSSRAGSAKPDPAIFGAALAALDVGAGETLHAGDEPLEDALGAHGAGLRAVLVGGRPSPRALPPGVALLGSLAELPALIDAETLA
jgi:putative hydrolase of the HAD superfamily